MIPEAGEGRNYPDCVGNASRGLDDPDGPGTGQCAKAPAQGGEDESRQLIDAANLIILKMNPCGEITYFNRFAQELFGFSEEEILGKNVVGTIVPERESSGRDLAVMIRNILEHPDWYENNENENICRDGRRVWVAWTNRAIFDAGRNLTGVLSIGNDVTERKRAEEMLRLDELRYEALFHLSQMTDAPADEIADFVLEQQIRLTASEIGFIGLMSEDGRSFTVHMVSKNVRDVEIAGVRAMHVSVDPGDFWSRCVVDQENIIVNDYPAAKPLKSGLPQGHPRLDRFLAIPVANEGKTVALLAVANKKMDYDASDARQLRLLGDGMWKIFVRKHARGKLKESEQKFRMLVEIMNEGLGMQDDNGRLKYVNGKFCEMLGYTSEELIGRPLIDFYADKTTYVDQVSKRQTGERSIYEMELIGKEGRRVHTLVSATPIFEGGMYKGSIGVVADITDRKKAEIALQHYAVMLESVNKELKDFIYVATHDLQEPLRKIQVFSSRLISEYRNSLDHGGRDSLEKVQATASRMQQLIESLLDYSRLTLKVEPFIPVDLNAVLRAVQDDLVYRIRQEGARIEVSGLTVIEAVPHQIFYLFRSLIDNSLKFRGKDAPFIRITGQIAGPPDARELEIAITDNGMGFEEKYLDRIFRPLQQLHARGRYAGTGMGLAISRKIVEQHGGTIVARSAPGRGTAFLVTLPEKQGAAVAIRY